MPKDRKRPVISDEPPLRVLIAPDKFKGTLTSEAAAKAIERGLRRAWPKVKTTPFTLTDGAGGWKITGWTWTGPKAMPIKR